MQFKLALKNVKKSFKDYTIYFLTIAFSVCLFYVFNSIGSQKTMDVLSDSSKSYYNLLVQMINGVSVFVSVILAFLIIYANKFLIKRRKKEISVYMILGMDKSKISAILVYETLLTGLVALVIGIAVGIFASQGLSVVVANLFKANMKKFQFAFSSSALLKTLIYFCVIFFLVMIFNVINITKCRLITLMQSGRKNEAGKVRSFPLTMTLFVVAVAFLIFAYNRIEVNGFMSMDADFWLAIGFGAAGTFLFFFSVSGFLNLIFKKNKNIYYRHLNIFTFRQFTSKINTNCISISLICLMLLLTIGVLACANGVTSAANSSIEKANPQDATFIQYEVTEYTGDDINVGIKKEGNFKYTIDKLTADSDFKRIVSNYCVVKEYFCGVNLKSYANKYSTSAYKDMNTVYSTAIKLSDYNKAMKMRGESELKLGKNQYAIIDSTQMSEALYDTTKKTNDITFGGKKLSYVGGEIIDKQLWNSVSASMMGLIVDDSVVEEKNLVAKDMLINYRKSVSDAESTFVKLTDKYTENEYGITECTTKQQASDASAGISTIATFISLYIGIIFLITSCAVLALQQLSESTDNAYRYKLIRKLGASSKDIHKALFQQIAAYFFMPLILAVIHSVFGIHTASKLIKLLGNINILKVSCITAGIIIVIYGGYFLATYYCSKSIIASQDRDKE